MELVEVIRGEQTDDQTVTALVALARRLGKTPIVVRDCPGFLVTRVLFPYLSQALELLREGVPDGRDRRRGRALRHADRTDRAAMTSSAWTPSWPSRASWPRAIPTVCRPARSSSTWCALGRLGQKSGAGFRKHDRNGSRPAADPAFESLLRQYQHQHHADSHSPAQEEITDRLFLPMLLEAIRAARRRHRA